ncbi:hypothetical protein NXS19_009208 [Fusarium pseudograminearum]|nr:hypothetical protein NXS19_009208 [Fusarium pseudograminearum]
MDINPWATRTDSLLFGWQELLEMDVPKPLYGTSSTEADPDVSGDDTATEGEDVDEDIEYQPDMRPEFRIIAKDDPAAYNFSSPQYSAHKLPKEVVDASMAGQGGLMEFAMQWKELTEGRGDGIWEKAAGAGT